MYNSENLTRDDRVGKLPIESRIRELTASFFRLFKERLSIDRISIREIISCCCLEKMVPYLLFGGAFRNVNLKYRTQCTLKSGNRDLQVSRTIIKRL